MDSDSVTQVDDGAADKPDTQTVTIETLPTGEVISQVISNIDVGSAGSLDGETKDQTLNKSSANSSTFIDGGTGTKLIELVKEYPELFDKTHPLYCNNSHKGVIWSRIAKELGIGSAKKTREQFSYMRKRFKTEYFARKQGLRRPLAPDPDSSNYRQPLFVYEQLQFLEQALENELTAGLMNETDTVDTSIVKEEYFDLDPPRLSIGANLGTSDALPSMDSYSPSRKRPTPGSLPSPMNHQLPVPPKQQPRVDPQQMMNFLKMLAEVQKNQQPKNDSDEECTLFGKQVAGDLRTLSMKNRAIARFQINKVLMELFLREIGHSKAD